MTERIRIVSSKVLSDFWGTVTGYEVDYTRADGTIQRLRRESYDHGHAAAVLLHDPKRDTVVLVRQFRFAAHLAGGPDFLLEVVAGLLEGDEPETCARREAMEEAGVAMIDCTHAFTVFVSPGSITERIHCFVGTYDGPVEALSGLGLRHEGEDIEVIELKLDAAYAMIGRGEIMDSKTVLLVQHLMLARR
ncbi:MAG: NUDIX domain-containing protein [Alphaproteobacteria bacterium]|nr:NUDIX domain-containing protein [Alphaproteobacteria bacterium]